MIKFNAVIKKLRIEGNHTQRSLAEKVKITPQYLANVEAGKKNPSFRLIEKICKALNVQTEWFFIETINADDFSGEEKRRVLVAKTTLKHYYERWR